MVFTISNSSHHYILGGCPVLDALSHTLLPRGPFPMAFFCKLFKTFTEINCLSLSKNIDLPINKLHHTFWHLLYGLRS